MSDTRQSPRRFLRGSPVSSRRTLDSEPNYRRSKTRETEEIEVAAIWLPEPDFDAIWYPEPSDSADLADSAEPLGSALELLDAAINYKENSPIFMYRDNRHRGSTFPELLPDTSAEGSSSARTSGGEARSVSERTGGQGSSQDTFITKTAASSTSALRRQRVVRDRGAKEREEICPEPPPPFDDQSETQEDCLGDGDEGDEDAIARQTTTLVCERPLTGRDRPRRENQPQAGPSTVKQGTVATQITDLDEFPSTIRQGTLNIPKNTEDSAVQATIESTPNNFDSKATGTDESFRLGGQVSVMVDTGTQANQSREPLAAPSGPATTHSQAPDPDELRDSKLAILRELGISARSFGYPLPPTPEVVSHRTSDEIRSSFPPVRLSDPAPEQTRALSPQFEYRKERVRLPSRRLSTRERILRENGCTGCIQSDCSCLQCMKRSIIAFNIVFLIFGLAIVGVGIWMLVDPRPWSYLQVGGANGNPGNGGNQGDEEEAGRFATVVTYMMLGIGGGMFFISLFGVFGAAFRNRCLLVSYVVFVSFLLVGQLGIVVLALMHQLWLGPTMRDAMMNFMAHRYDGGVSLVSKAWDTMQVNLRCCGVDGRDDYVRQYSLWYNTTGAGEDWRWPKSCCPLAGNDPDDDLLDPERCRQGVTTYTATCYSELTEWFRSWGAAIGGIMIVIVAMQLIIVIMAGLMQQDIMEKALTIGPYP